MAKKNNPSQRQKTNQPRREGGGVPRGPQQAGPRRSQEQRNPQQRNPQERQRRSQREEQE